jgi:hypothetical protein
MTFLHSEEARKTFGRREKVLLIGKAESIEVLRLEREKVRIRLL